MKMNNPLVSIIIPSKNRPAFVLKAIESVMKQTYRNFEIIVVDDGSDVSLAPLLAGEFGDKVICLRHGHSCGASAARNTGIIRAKGAYIAFLDDDDVWLPEKLEKQMNVFVSNENTGLVFCGEALVSDGEIVKRRPAAWDGKRLRSMLAYNVIGGTSTVLIRKKELLNNLFDADLRSCQDWDLFLRLSMTVEITAVPEILVARTIHGSQISGFLGNKIIGREQFYVKHKHLIDRYPPAKAQHFRRLGSLFVLKSENGKAQRFFKKALRSRPLDWRNWVCVLVSYFFPTQIAIRILSRYAVTRIGSYSQFH